MKIRFAVSPGTSVPEHDAIVQFADALEASAFDGIWLSDLPVAAALDPLLGLALIAGRTARLHLGANVVPLGRNPFLLAKTLAQLDWISHGRLLLSFVPGLAQAGEREVLGLGVGNRGDLLEQSLERVRAHWGQAWTKDACGAAHPAATPLQTPLEVWLGGRGPKALERAGRIAEGWLGAAVTPAEASAAREQIQASAAAAGREIDPEHFGMSIPYARSAPPAAQRARRADVDPRALLPVGAPALRSIVARYVEAGLSKFVVRPVVSVESWKDEVDWLSDAILDLQT